MNRMTTAAVGALSVFVSVSTATAQGACCTFGGLCLLSILSEAAFPGSPQDA